MNHNIEIIKSVKEYYDKKLAEHGPTVAGVDWNSYESQRVRFMQLTKVIKEDSHFSLNDFGCGYGALYDYLLLTKKCFDYLGFDVSENMILHACDIYRDQSHCDFISDINAINISDYTIASGIFNVKLSADNRTWLDYTLSILDHLDEISNKGFSFNCLTSYADKKLMKDHLYYADPLYFFDYCKKNYAKNIALLHDYNLYEFTILVRKQC